MKKEKTIEIEFNSEEYKTLFLKSQILEPYHEASSLHVHQEYYEIYGEKYSFLYNLNNADNLPIIEKIINPTNEEITKENELIESKNKYDLLKNSYQFIKTNINDEIQYIIENNEPYFIYNNENIKIYSFYKVRSKHILVEEQKFIEPSTEFYYIEDKSEVKLDKKKKLLIEILTNLKAEISKRNEIYKHGVDLINYENYYSDSTYKLLAFIVGDGKFSIDEIQWWLYEDVEKIYYFKDKEYNVEKVEDFVDYLLYENFFK